MAAAFLGTVFYIGKIVRKIAPEKEVFALVFFGLQPLVVIESLVSGHLDIVMFFFAVFAFYLLLQKKYFWSIIVLAISIGIKFVTAFLLPVFLFVFLWQIRKKTIPWDRVFYVGIFIMAISVVFASLRTNFQPWYLLAPLLLTPFVGQRYFIFIPSFIISFFALLTYVPYLFTGNWDPPIPQMLQNMYVMSYVLSGIIVGFFAFYRITKSKK
jgi:hypothetical protein